MVYVLAVAAALSNALTSVFQRMGVEDAPEESTMRLSLMAHAIRRGVWLLGFGFMICAFLLQAFALHNGRLSVVQPILTMELLFLVFILGTYFRFSISIREWVGAGAIAIGLSGFLFFADPGGGEQVPTNLGWIVVGGCASALIVLTVIATRWGPRWWKAAMFGTSAAISYAFTAALIKVVSDYAATNWVTLFEHWQTYAVIAFGLLGLFLTQNAFHAGPLAASQSTLVLVDPLASICMGIALFGDSLRTSGPYGPLEAALAPGDVHGRRVPVQLAVDHGHEERRQGRRVRRDAVAAAEAPAPRHAGRRERRRPAALLVRLIRRRRLAPPRGAPWRRSGLGATGARRAARWRSRRRLHRARWRPATRRCGDGGGSTPGRRGRRRAGTASAVTSKGGPSTRMPRRSATKAGPSARRSARPPLGQAVPGPFAHHPLEEALRFLARVVGQAAGHGFPVPACRRKPSHGMGGSKAPMASKAPGEASAAPITTLPPRLCPTATTGRRRRRRRAPCPQWR